jgi:ribosomal protein L37AE/L43A
MKKETVLISALSLLAWFIPSLVIALALFLMFGHFLVMLLCSLGIVWLLGQLSNLFFQQKGHIEIEKLKLKLIEINNQQSAEVSCAYCKERNLVPIKLNIRNVFKCKQCKQSCLIIFQFATAQITTPLEEPQLGSTDEYRRRNTAPTSGT